MQSECSAIAVAVGHIDGIRRLFPVVDLSEARRELMRAACMAGIGPGSKLEGAYATIGLACAIDASTLGFRRNPSSVSTQDRGHANQPPCWGEKW